MARAVPQSQTLSLDGAHRPRSSRPGSQRARAGRAVPDSEPRWRAPAAQFPTRSLDGARRPRSFPTRPPAPLGFSLAYKFTLNLTDLTYAGFASTYSPTILLVIGINYIPCPRAPRRHDQTPLSMHLFNNNHLENHKNRLK